MQLNFKKIIGIVFALLLVAVNFSLINGWLPVPSKHTHPPCEILPSVTEVIKALDNNQNFADRIETLGENIDVDVGQPCSDDQDRALIQVTYKSKSEETSIHNLLSASEGFGVPIHLVKKR